MSKIILHICEIMGHNCLMETILEIFIVVNGLNKSYYLHLIFFHINPHNKIFTK